MITTEDALAILTKKEDEELKKLIASLPEEELKEVAMNLAIDATMAAFDFQTEAVFRAIQARATQAPTEQKDTPLIPAIRDAFEAGWLRGFDDGMRAIDAALKVRALQ